MKKLLSLALLIFFVFTSFAQKTYSIQNLEKVSKLDLESYLKKSKKKKVAGAILTITGTSLIITGQIWDNNIENRNLGEYKGPDIVGPIGAYSVLAGIPFFIVGSVRVNRIKKIMNNVPGRVFFELAPCSINNYMVQNYQAGLTVRMRF